MADATEKGWWESITGWLYSFLEPVLTPLKKVLYGFIGMVAFAATLTGSLASVMDVGETFQNIGDTMVSATAMLGNLQVSSVIGQLNRIFPLNEFMVLASSLLGLQLLVVAVKFGVWFLGIVVKVLEFVRALLPG
jgi:hypothetical protein